jgi:hypothetical protein
MESIKTDINHFSEEEKKWLRNFKKELITYMSFKKKSCRVYDRAISINLSTKWLRDKGIGAEWDHLILTPNTIKAIQIKSKAQRKKKRPEVNGQSQIRRPWFRKPESER